MVAGRPPRLTPSLPFCADVLPGGRGSVHAAHPPCVCFAGTPTPLSHRKGQGQPLTVPFFPSYMAGIVRKGGLSV